MIRAVTDPPITAGAGASANTRSKDTQENAGGFAAELNKADATKTAVKKAPVVKGEKTDPIEGHGYAEVIAGPRNGMFINTSGNERHGQAFLVVEREGRRFHVYGTGDDRKVFEVKPQPKPAATTPAATTPAATTPAATTPVATTPAAPVAAAPTLPFS